MYRIATIFFVLCFLAAFTGASIGIHMGGRMGMLIGGLPGFFGMVGFLIWLGTDEARTYEYALEETRREKRIRSHMQAYRSGARGR